MRFGLDSYSSFGSILEEEKAFEALGTKLSSSFINAEPVSDPSPLPPLPKTAPKRKPSRMLPGGWYWSIVGFDEPPCSQESACSDTMTEVDDDAEGSDPDAPMTPIPERARRPYNASPPSNDLRPPTPTKDSPPRPSHPSAPAAKRHRSPSCEPSRKRRPPLRRSSTVQQEDWRSSKPYPLKAQKPAKKANPIVNSSKTSGLRTSASRSAFSSFRAARDKPTPVSPQSSGRRAAEVTDEEVAARAKEVGKRRQAEMKEREAKIEALRFDRERRQRRARLERERMETARREKARQESEAKERLRKQREADEEEKARARAWEEAHRRAEAQEKAAATSPRSTVADSWSLYQTRWAILADLQRRNESPSSHLPISFSQIPWPIIRTIHHTQNGQVPTSITPADITSPAIREFLLSSTHSEGLTRRQRIRAATLLWHPDKFEAKVMHRLIEDEVEMVREGALSVIRALNSNFE